MKNVVLKPKPKEDMRIRQSRRRVDKVQQIMKLVARINDVKDQATLNNFRNEIIKILMTL